MALYNEVRPQTLSELKGQEDVIKILRKSVAGGTLPNAALFVGTRGTGKTTVARIIAKMVNCENPKENGDPCCTCPTCEAIKNGQSLDVIELDAASNNGVDDVRRIIELVQYKTVSKKKVVILDECHMLSQGAFNALLKVLEEPPEGVLFILCTTEVHKVPATILSRCRKFQFRTLTLTEITSKLAEIAKGKGKTAQDGALALVAKAAKGSMRDAESIFESFLELDEITEAEVRKVLGFSSEERIVKILAAVADREPDLIKYSIEEAVDKGENLNRFMEDCIEALVRIAGIKLDGDCGTEGTSDLTELAFRFEPEQIFELIDAIRRVYESKPSNPEVSLLAALVVQICYEDRIAILTEEIERLKASGIRIASEPVMTEEPQAEEAAEALASDADEEEWERVMNVADFEDAYDVPFPDEPAAPAADPEPYAAPVPKGIPAPKPEAPKPAHSTLSKKALSSLAAAGFVVESAEEEAPEPERKQVNNEPAKEPSKKSAEDAYFEELEAMFKF
jgi:DNA polymerase-3 subunit gamma/tau